VIRPLNQDPVNIHKGDRPTAISAPDSGARRSARPENNGAQSSLEDDVRWQLIERIVASSSFQRSERLRDLLRYVAEKTLRGDTDDLGEHRIGVAVFGKPENYSIVEDSSVRVHVRQLRLKLHQYFDSEGRKETCVVEIPKGAYTAVFRILNQEEPHPPEPKIGLGREGLRLLPWGLTALFLTTTLLASFHRTAKPSAGAPPWPLSALLDDGSQPVEIVVADANFGLARLFSKQRLTLQQYLSPEYRSGELIAKSGLNNNESQVVDYWSRSVLTSYADVTVAMSLERISGDGRDRLVVRSAHSLSPHDFDQGNFVLVGGAASNPWVDYFTDMLNFRENLDPDGSGSDCFLNLHPKPGESQTYCSPPLTGSAGASYATISLLPLPDGHGSALILQGLHQEATEAAGVFLADSAKRQTLQSALGMPSGSTHPIYFEALIRTESIAGAPVGTSSLVTVRLFHP